MELEPIVFALGRWGAKSLAEPRPDEVVTGPSLVSALRTTFCPEQSLGVRVNYELQAGDIVVHAKVDNGKLVALEGPLENADLVIEAGPGMKAVMAHEISAEEAIANGIVRVKGDPQLLELFADLFRIGDAEAIASA